jgi:hypothetical protein
MLALLLLACAGPPAERPAPVLALGAPRPVAPEVVVAGAWERDFARDPASAVVPMAVLADGDGFAVLDQEAARIRRFDATGAPRGEVPIPGRATLDAVARAEGFGLLAYRRLPSPTWFAQDVSRAGTLRDEVALVVEEAPPSGIFEDDGRLLVELAHGDLVDPSTGERFPGRPAGQGWYARAEKAGPREVALRWQDREGLDVREVTLACDRALSNVVSLDPFLTPEGLPAAQVGLLLFGEGPEPAHAMIDAEIRLVTLDALGHPLDELSVAVLEGGAPQRPFARTADGALLALRPDRDGLRVERVAP